METSSSETLASVMIRTLNTLLIIIFVAGGVALAQQDDVVQISTELVQTGVTFLDKQGRLVDGLKKEDFELRVDGRVVPISFFENIVAGSQRDRLTRIRGNEFAKTKDSSAEASFRQRTIIFFRWPRERDKPERRGRTDSVERRQKIRFEFPTRVHDIHL